MSLDQILEMIPSYVQKEVSYGAILIYADDGCFSVVRPTDCPGYVEADGRLMDAEDFTNWMYRM